MQIWEELGELLLIAPEVVEEFGGTRVDRENDWQAVHIGDDLLHEGFEMLLLIDISRAVHGHHDVLLIFESKRIVESRTTEACTIGKQGIDHHITHIPYMLYIALEGVLLFG